MARLRIEPAGIDLDVRDGETVMEAASRSGYRWPTVCGGQAECTTCAFEALGDPGAFSDADELERAALGRLPERRLRPEATFRLACQARLHGDAVVRKRGVRPAEPTGPGRTSREPT